MKISIDEKLCKQNKLSIPQLLFILAVKSSSNILSEIKDLSDKEALVEQNDEWYITPHWADVVDEILLNSTEIADYEEWYKQLAKDLAQTFPQGKMPGTAYYYKCNNKEITLKLKKFFSVHTEYKPSKEMAERIIEAGKRYNRDMDLNPRYRVLAKYFVIKNKAIVDEDGSCHPEEQSLLASYLENEGEDSPADDWLITSRN